MKTLAETQAFDGVVVPEDGVDARTAASLYPAFEALTGRSNWLKAKTADLETALGQARDDLGGSIDDTQQGLEAQLTAAITNLTNEINAVRSLVGGVHYKYSTPDGSYTLPANTNIRLLEIDTGYGTVPDGGDINDYTPHTTLDLSQPQPEGKMLTIQATTSPPSADRTKHTTGSVAMDPVGTIYERHNFRRFAILWPAYKDWQAVTLIYLGGVWRVTANYGGVFADQETN